ncbi:ROK family protein [Streptomyces sp. NPDC092369]|uniref:ROK family protein n=1 Tax=Streptomyces sp. NPDC092369 TaxID=3366015 RepID=UPI0038287279
MPVLDIGGTHVTAALVDPATGRPLPSSVLRRPLRSDAAADSVLDAIALAALELPAGHRSHWGVAIPGPFDYDTGVGRFTGVGKFEALSGVDVGAGLRRRLAHRAEHLRFLNDADAFAIGEYHAGAAAGHERVVCLTLGTGVGSSFLRDGRPVHDGTRVPPDGHVHRLTVRGLPLEESVSRRAIRAHYSRLDGVPGNRSPLDVHQIAALARAGNPAAAKAFRYAFEALGQAVAPWVDRFEASAVVIGGSMAQSWDLIRPALFAGLVLAGGTTARVSPARQPAQAPLIGAAHWAQDASNAARRGPAGSGTPPRLTQEGEAV